MTDDLISRADAIAAIAITALVRLREEDRAEIERLEAALRDAEETLRLVEHQIGRAILAAAEKEARAAALNYKGETGL